MRCNLFFSFSQAELGKPNSSYPDKGKVSIHVDCSPTAEPTFEVLNILFFYVYECGCEWQDGNICIVIEYFYTSHQIKGLGTMGNMTSACWSFKKLKG